MRLVLLQIFGAVKHFELDHVDAGICAVLQHIEPDIAAVHPVGIGILKLRRCPAVTLVPSNYPRNGFKWLCKGDSSHIRKFEIHAVSRIHFESGSILGNRSLAGGAGHSDLAGFPSPNPAP